FVLFLPSREEEGARLVEDGFAVSLRETMFQRLRQALIQGTPLEVEPSGELMAFSLRVMPSVYSDPISGRDLVASGGWKTYEPAGRKPREAGPVAVDGVVVLTPET